LTDQEH